MTTHEEIIYLHLWLAVAIAFFFWAFRGNYFVRVYDFRRRFFFLLPWSLQNKDRWIRHQKIIAGIGIVLVAVTYVLALIKIISGG